MFRRAAGRDIQEPDALPDLVELRGGLPLAIAIVGQFRNRKTLTVEYLQAELTEATNRLDPLRYGSRAVAAAFHLSYRDLLSRQRFFRMLGVHPAKESIISSAALSGVTPAEASTHLDALFHECLLDEIVLSLYDTAGDRHARGLQCDWCPLWMGSGEPGCLFGLHSC
jgi:hypothetical protein